MVRPLTCICFLLAVGSGAYLYLTKYEAQLLDRQIEKTLKETDALREQTRMLHAEWTLLNDPERLRLFADQYLTLQSVAPRQFTSMADLGGRLPAIRPPEPEPMPSPTVPGETPFGPTDLTRFATAEPAATVEDLPIPPLPVPPPPASVFASLPIATANAAPAPAPAQPVAERKPPVTQRPPLQAMEAPQARPSVTGGDVRPPPPPRPIEQRVVEQRPTEQRSPIQAQPVQAQPAPTRAQLAPAPVHAAPVYAPPVLASAQAPAYGGSLLGMSQGGGVPAPVPRPTPVGGTNFFGAN